MRAVMGATSVTFNTLSEGFVRARRQFMQHSDWRVADGVQHYRPPSTFRHGRACPGHPRLSRRWSKDVDARHKGRA